MFDKIIEKIKEFDTIIIHRHVRPDGDCIGSQMGLKAILKESFPEKHIYAVCHEAPDYLQPYMNDVDDIADNIYSDALVIVVDTAVESRIADERWKTGKFIVKIDHHDDSPEYGELNYIDPASPACASLIVRMVNSSKGELKLNTEAAKLLFFGMVTDTGRFRFRGVDSEVLCNAGKLLEYDFDLQQVYDDLYIESPQTMKLKGYVLTHYKLTPNGVAYIYFTKKIMQEYQVSKEDAGNLVSNLSTIEGSLIWVVFIDQMLESNPNIDLDPATEIRCRLRSRNVSINDIGAKYRGGGHLQAAGATIYNRKEMRNLLKDLDERLALYKAEHPDAR